MKKEIKTILVTIPIIILFALLLGCLKRAPKSQPHVGTVLDIGRYIAQLMASTNKGSYLIIQIKGTHDFLQFSAGDNLVQLDFPQVTSIQKSFGAKFREAAKTLSLSIVENTGTDGSLFLDIDIDGSAEEISEVVICFLEEFYGVSEQTKLEFFIH